MGGTYNNIMFSDRFSKHPNRRRLIPVIDPSTNTPIDNLYDVQREEGEVFTEGTPYNAQTMNRFNNNINSMFPVSVSNGGTGFTNIQEFLNTYNLSTRIKNYNNYKNYFNLSSFDGLSKYESSFNQGMCYIFGKFCLMSINIKSKCTFSSNAASHEINKYICIKNLPYIAYYDPNNTAGESRYIYMTCAISTYKMDGSEKTYGDYLIDSEGNHPKYTVAYLDTQNNIISLFEATSKNRIYIEKDTYININITGTYFIK